MAKYLKRLSLSIQKYENPIIIKSRFSFNYERFEEPKLRILRERYNLGKVVKKGKDEFRKMVLLREWVKSQWWHGTPSKEGNKPDALHILRRVRKGEQFFCDHYSVTFIQCALSLGWNARRVAIHTSGYNGHTVAEIWSNQYKKWIIMDTDFNIHYERNGIPLNALELHKIWINEGSDGIQKIKICKGKPRPKSNGEMLCCPWRLVDYYYRFGITLGNDFFSRAKKGKILGWDLLPPAAWWFDEKTIKIKGAKYLTDKESELYWTLNQTYIEPKPHRANVLSVDLNTFTPNFKEFLVKIDNRPLKKKGSRFLWKLHSGINKIEAKAINKFGIEGIPSYICVERRKL